MRAQRQFIAAMKAAIPPSAKWSLAISFVSNLVLLLSILPVFSLPRGTGIRPMAQAALAFIFAFGNLFTASPLAIKSFLGGNRKGVSILAMLMSLSPAPFFVTLMRVLELSGYELED
jgi:hypothetical protein